jgi:DNA-binding transcriptional ArsR family regulator
MKTQSLFHALTDPSRRKILKLLQQGPLSAGELSQHFSFSLASLSHHLSILKSADLVRTERRGQYIIYSLNTSVTEEIYRLMADLFSKTISGEST